MLFAFSVGFLLPRDTAREAKCLLLKTHLLLQGHPLPCLLAVVSVWNDFSERRGTGLLLLLERAAREKCGALILSSAAPCMFAATR